MPKEISIREEAPLELRRAVVELAVRAGLNPDELLTQAIYQEPEERPWVPPTLATAATGGSQAVALERVIERWERFRVYDFVEVIYTKLRNRAEVASRQAEQESLQQASINFEEEFGYPPPDGREADFERELNEYFVHAGVGWQLVDGQIQMRGPEAFEAVVHTAIEELQSSERLTARGEIHEALRDLSRRPDPDITGAIQHAMAALECVARDVAGEPKATLGEILKRNPDLIQEPLRTSVEKAWGYASEMGRHVREGRKPEREEAELVVGLAATVATYLSRKNPT